MFIDQGQLRRRMPSKLFKMWRIVASIDAMGDDFSPPNVVF